MLIWYEVCQPHSVHENGKQVVCFSHLSEFSTTVRLLVTYKSTTYNHIFYWYSPDNFNEFIYCILNKEVPNYEITLTSSYILRFQQFLMLSGSVSLNLVQLQSFRSYVAIPNTYIIKTFMITDWRRSLLAWNMIELFSKL